MDKIILGKQLRAMRLNRKFSVQLVSEKLGITVNTLIRLEAGEIATLKVELLIKLIKSYGYDLTFKEL